MCIYNALYELLGIVNWGELVKCDEWFMIKSVIDTCIVWLDPSYTYIALTGSGSWFALCFDCFKSQLNILVFCELISYPFPFQITAIAQYFPCTFLYVHVYYEHVHVCAFLGNFTKFSSSAHANTVFLHIINVWKITKVGTK